MHKQNRSSKVLNLHPIRISSLPYQIQSLFTDGVFVLGSPNSAITKGLHKQVGFFQLYIAKSISSLQQESELTKDGFMLNHARILVGSGFDTYQKGKSALQTWRHFNLNWTFVDSETPIQNGAKFCVCVKEFLPWVMMPLQVVFVHESTNEKKSMASFSFGSGTLDGHLLAGEERFSINLDEKNRVWYEIVSLSKPAHFLSVIGKPYVRAV